MRQHIIAFCGIVFLASCGTVALGAKAAHAAAFRDAKGASIHLPLPLAHAAEGHDAEGGQAQKGGWRHFVSWVGHFHPPLTVFPIAMILSAALAELLRIWTKAPWLGGASRFCMIIGGVGAAITAPLGWAFATGHGNSWILQVHRWLGTSAASHPVH